MLIHNTYAFSTIQDIAKLYSEKIVEIATPPSPDSMRVPISHLILSDFFIFSNLILWTTISLLEIAFYDC